jgi:hypothetical protein
MRLRRPGLLRGGDSNKYNKIRRRPRYVTRMLSVRLPFTFRWLTVATRAYLLIQRRLHQSDKPDGIYQITLRLESTRCEGALAGAMVHAHYCEQYINLYTRSLLFCL